MASAKEPRYEHPSQQAVDRLAGAIAHLIDVRTGRDRPLTRRQARVAQSAEAEWLMMSGRV
jgi:hypothetical protein